MKKNTASLLFIFIACCNLFLKGQQHEFVFANHIKGTTISRGFSVAYDAAGNTYVTGDFSGTADFDPSPNTATLSSYGSKDIFVAKYDVSGNYVWAFHVGDAVYGQYGAGTSIHVSGSDLYVTGFFMGDVDFDPSPGTATASANYDDIFVAKYTTNGAYQWSFALNGFNAGESGTCVRTNTLGDVFVAGQFSSLVDFDPSPATATLSGGSDIFLAKYSSAGNYQWAFKIGASGGLDNAGGISIDPLGDVVLAGTFDGSAGTVDFDPSPATATLVNAGYQDAFIAKYNSSGAYQWAKSFGSTSNDIALSVDTDPSGNIFVTGAFFGTTDFDPSVNTATITPVGQRDIFIAKYNPSGNYQWAFNIGTSNDDYGMSLSTDASGNVYATGMFEGTADLDPSPATATISSQYGTAYIAKYNGSGNYQWAFGFNSVGGYSYGRGIKVNSTGNVCLTGYFSNQVDFDPAPATATLNSPSVDNIFVAGYKPCSLPTTPVNASPGGNQQVCENNSASLAVSSTGSVSWYASPTSTTAIANGSVLVTPTLAVGTYSYYAESVNGCGTSLGRAFLTVTVTVCTGISELGNVSGSLQMYPNPASDMLTVKSAQGILQNMKIYSLCGQLVMERNSSSVKEEIDLSQLPQGYYTVEMITASGKFTGKLAVSR